MSNIEWTDATWNPVVGCTPVSSGCLNCYAATMAKRLEGMGQEPYVGLTVGGKTCARPRGYVRFDGTVRTLADRLVAPLGWKKPRRVFVCSMSDLFHAQVPFEFIDRVFAVMALCPQHTFQVLTKRPERMAKYTNELVMGKRSLGDCLKGLDCEGLGGRLLIMKAYGVKFGAGDGKPPYKPFPNVWLGTSVEDQAAADDRIPHLLNCPAAVRFLSCEPLLGPVSVWSEIWRLKNMGHEPGPKGGSGKLLHWVIVGGESGPGARACEVEWVRSIVKQCKGAGVPCFVKQLGTKPVNGAFLQQPVTGKIDSPAGGNGRRFVDRKGGDPAEWPDNLRVRQFPLAAGDLAAPEPLPLPSGGAAP